MDKVNSFAEENPITFGLIVTLALRLVHRCEFQRYPAGRGRGPRRSHHATQTRRPHLKGWTIHT